MEKNHPLFNLEEGVVMLVDKPLHWTSFDVVNKLRYTIKRTFGLKKVKVGHAGTLDPLATGLLLVCAGKATKRADELQAEEKEYTGTIMLGATTPSFDLETEIQNQVDASHISIVDAQQAADQLTGNILQTPPIFSAKKKDGKTAYNLAREGKEVKLDPVPVEIQVFDIVSKNENELNFRVVCSKGTYIRSLAHDIGQILKVGGYLTSLRRTRSGHFKVEDAQNVENWVDKIQQLPNNQKNAL